MGSASQARGAQQELLRRALHPPRCQGCILQSVTRGRGAGRWRRGGKRLAEGRSGRRARGDLCRRPSSARTSPPPAAKTRPVLGAPSTEAALLYRGTHTTAGRQGLLWASTVRGWPPWPTCSAAICIYRDADIVEGFPIHEIPREAHAQGRSALLPRPRGRVSGRGGVTATPTGRSGDDGFTINSLDPDAEDFRPDLAEKLTAVGSYF